MELLAEVVKVLMGINVRLYFEKFTHFHFIWKVYVHTYTQEPGLEQVEHWGLLCGWQGLKHLNCDLLLPGVHTSRKLPGGLEAVGLRSAPGAYSEAIPWSVESELQNKAVLNSLTVGVVVWRELLNRNSMDWHSSIFCYLLSRIKCGTSFSEEFFSGQFIFQGSVVFWCSVAYQALWWTWHSNRNQCKPSCLSGILSLSARRWVVPLRGRKEGVVSFTSSGCLLCGCVQHSPWGLSNTFVCVTLKKNWWN